MIYTDDDRIYYEKIAPLGRRELLAERERWQKKFRRRKIKWNYGKADAMSADELYFQLIEINREYANKTKKRSLNGSFYVLSGGVTPTHVGK